MKEFTDFGTADEVEFDAEGYERSNSFIRRQLRALIANQLWGINEYYQCINEENPILKEALTQMKGDSFKKLKLRY
jgi:carboxyl-terminal processing protease